MGATIEEQLLHRRPFLAYYSPYSFIRKIKQEAQVDLFVLPKLEKFGHHTNYFQMEVWVDEVNFVFLYEYLSWDSQYFKRPCFKLFTVLYATQNHKALVKAICTFKAKIVEQHPFCYCLSEIPAEDTFLLQGLTQASIRMVETRLQLFRTNLSTYESKRYSVREATLTEADKLAAVAAQARNPYDRLHADYAFTEEEADAYLATYAREAVHGFCDKVFVPNVQNLETASFIAFDYHEKITDQLDISLLYARLAAISPANSGWYLKLVSEVLHYAKERNCTYIKVSTQGSNKAVVRTLESLGFQYGATTHILVFNN